MVFCWACFQIFKSTKSTLLGTTEFKLRYSSDFSLVHLHLQHLISKSAIRTKFEAHERRAREIVAAMRANLDVVQNNALRRKLVFS